MPADRGAADRRELVGEHEAGGGPASAPLIVADELTKVYDTVAATRALSDVTFDVHAGEFAAIVGQSGSGKSTLLNLLGLLDTPTEGRVLVEGRETAAAGRRGRAVLRNQYLGFVFQFHHLLPESSVLENVVMPALIAEGVEMDAHERRRRALDVLGMLGLEAVAEKNANQLSGGQKQRVAIARALMNRPPVILADEPTGDLDTENSAAVYRLFREINADLGTTFLIVTHDRGIAEQTDRIIEVVDGELVQDVRNTYLDRR
ncbi:MAG: ABC transporter ATP-binding protein [Actinobacteria bacterium]|nr:ABC transporter ATP-binding protein [Actinomycetota bacterium]